MNKELLTQVINEERALIIWNFWCAKYIWLLNASVNECIAKREETEYEMNYWSCQEEKICYWSDVSEMDRFQNRWMQREIDRDVDG